MSTPAGINPPPALLLLLLLSSLLAFASATPIRLYQRAPAGNSDPSSSLLSPNVTSYYDYSLVRFNLTYPPATDTAVLSSFVESNLLDVIYKYRGSPSKPGFWDVLLPPSLAVNVNVTSEVLAPNVTALIEAEALDRNHSATVDAFRDLSGNMMQVLLADLNPDGTPLPQDGLVRVESVLGAVFRRFVKRPFRKTLTRRALTGTVATNVTVPIDLEDGSVKVTDPSRLFKEFHPVDVYLNATGTIGAAISPLGVTALNRTVHGLTVGTGKYHVVLLGGSSGRDWLSPAVVNYIAYYFTADPALQGFRDTFSFTFIPVLNVDAYNLTLTDPLARLWPKNLQSLPGSNCAGVNLERNYVSGWNATVSGNTTCSPSFKGFQPLEALETQILSTYLQDVQNLTAGSLVSFVEVKSAPQSHLLYPYGYSSDRAVQFTELQAGALAASDFLNLTANVTLPTGQYYDVIGQDTGSALDSALSFGVPYSYQLNVEGSNFGIFANASAEVESAGAMSLTAIQALLRYVNSSLAIARPGSGSSTVLTTSLSSVLSSGTISGSSSETATATDSASISGTVTDTASAETSSTGTQTGTDDYSTKTCDETTGSDSEPTGTYNAGDSGDDEPTGTYDSGDSGDAGDAGSDATETSGSETTAVDGVSSETATDSPNETATDDGSGSDTQPAESTDAGDGSDGTTETPIEGEPTGTATGDSEGSTPTVTDASTPTWTDKCWGDVPTETPTPTGSVTITDVLTSTAIESTGTSDLSSVLPTSTADNTATDVSSGPAPTSTETSPADLTNPTSSTDLSGFVPVTQLSFMKRHNGDDWHNFPPCEEDVSDPAYDDNGFGYGFENGKSCLLPLDYCKLYDKWDYCESKGISNGGDSSSDDEDWKNFPPCESEVSDPEYDPNGYGYGFENDKSCLIPLDYCKLYDKWDYCASKDIFATGDDWQHFPPCTGYILNPAKDHNGYRYGQENGHSCLAQWDYCELYGKEYWCEERGVKKGTRVYYCTGPSYVSTTLTTESATQTVTTTTTTTSESVTASESETASMPSGSESASVSTATGASTVTGTSSGTSTRSV